MRAAAPPVVSCAMYPIRVTGYGIWAIGYERGAPNGTIARPLTLLSTIAAAV